MKPEWLHALLAPEFDQRREEGCEVRPLLQIWEHLRDEPPLAVERELAALWTLLEGLVTSDDHEPSTLPEIRALRPEGPRDISDRTDRSRLPDRLHGALLGRIAGCQLGKPVEGWHHSSIDAWLAAAGETEIRDYLPELEQPPEERYPTIKHRACCRGRLAGAQRDDDQDYTLLGLLLLDRHGPSIRPAQIAEAWLELLPYQQTYTAERAAYRNMIDGLTPPESATRFNPYREWIGAQIRCDGWAYASAGLPQQAAELAFRDASLSHVKNGIYGEMLFGAMIAAALVTDDVPEAIVIGLSEIPADCRLSRAMRQVIAWASQEPDWRGCWQRIETAYGHLSWVHTINNAALVLLGLLYGQGDFSATIGIAVHGGWDTDCNGATAGSVLGAMLGAKGLPKHWTEPLQDTMRSALFGHGENRISELAAMALRLNETVRL